MGMSFLQIEVVCSKKACLVDTVIIGKGKTQMKEKDMQLLVGSLIFNHQYLFI